MRRRIKCACRVGTEVPENRVQRLIFFISPKLPRLSLCRRAAIETCLGVVLKRMMASLGNHKHFQPCPVDRSSARVNKLILAV